MLWTRAISRPTFSRVSRESDRFDLTRALADRLLRGQPTALLAHGILAAGAVAFLWGTAPRTLVLGWASALALAIAARTTGYRLMTRRPGTPQDVIKRLRLLVVGTGIAWGAGVALLTSDLTVPQWALLLTVLAGLVSPAMTTIDADPVAFRLFLVATLGPVPVAVLSQGIVREHVFALFLIPVFAAFTWLINGRLHTMLVQHLLVASRLADSEEQAQRATAAKAAFLASMSHEIRTPMNAVLGFVELVLETDLSTEQRRALELVRSSSESLLTILNDILDYSKIEAEHLDLEVIPFDLPKVVHATVSLLAVRAREKHLELAVDVPPDVPVTVRGDPTRLRQVLMNLIGNAIKFTEEGEIGVSAALVRYDGGRAWMEFRVRDTGIGIPEDQLANIFQEFTQADASMTRRYGGTGLGLAISRRVVTLMGGDLKVTSAVRRGSEFRFTVPFHVEAAAKPAAGKPVSLGGRRLLVVDDNETNRRIVRDMLGAEGATVHEAARADAGLEVLTRAARAGTPYDLAILDVQMPDRDGFELAAAIRATPDVAATRLLMLTSVGQRGDGERCRQLGIQAYLTKPIVRADLVEGVTTVLGEPAVPGAHDVITRHTIAESRQALRILLAEDNPVNQQVAVAMLVKRGHDVHVVGNGREAVDAVAARDYDVVLMDIQMPEMDGFAATEQIRGLPQGRVLPIIALTAHALSGERERCLAQGMSGYLTKPFKAHDLFAVVEGAPGHAPAAEAPAAPPVDLEAFRATMREAGAADAVDGILDTFVEHADAHLDKLAAAAAAGDGTAIARAAHAFKSAAGSIGASALAATLAEVERAGKAGEIEGARDRLAQARREGQAVVAYVQRVRNRTPG